MVQCVQPAQIVIAPQAAVPLTGPQAMETGQANNPALTSAATENATMVPSFREAMSQQSGGLQDAECKPVQSPKTAQSVASAAALRDAQSASKQSKKPGAAKTSSSETSPIATVETLADGTVQAASAKAASIEEIGAASAVCSPVAMTAISPHTDVAKSGSLSADAIHAAGSSSAKGLLANTGTNEPLQPNTSLDATAGNATVMVEVEASAKDSPVATLTGATALVVSGVVTPVMQPQQTIAHAGHSAATLAASVPTGYSPEGLTLRSYESPTPNQLEVGFAGPDGTLRIRAEITAGGDVHTMLRAGSTKLESELQLQTATMSAYLSAEGVAVKSIQVDTLRGGNGFATGPDTNSSGANDGSRQQDEPADNMRHGDAAMAHPLAASLTNFFNFSSGSEAVLRNGFNGMGGWVSVLA